MSGLIKGVKKVFAKVAPTLKKVLPIALAVGAVVFTAGAALAPAGSFLAGGWGGAVGSAVSGMGLSGTTASILTGAVTQAGYGAAIGGAASAVMGGDFADGAGLGALGGAAVGGIGGAMTGGLGGVSAAAADGAQYMSGGTAAASGTGGTAAAAGGGLGSWLSNPTVVGSVIQGVGSGLGKYAESSARAAADEAKAKRLTDSYKVGAGAYHQATPDDGVVRPTPAQAYPDRKLEFQPDQKQARRYRFNRDMNVIEYV